MLVASLFSQHLHREAGRERQASGSHRAQAHPAKLRRGVAAQQGPGAHLGTAALLPGWGGCEEQRGGWQQGLALLGPAVAAALGSGAQSAVHCIYLYINKDSSAVTLQ